jgi:hypothetical protein
MSRPAFLEKYVDVAVVHTLSNGGFFTKLEDDNDGYNIICHHLIRRKLITLLQFGKSGKYSKPTSPQYAYWCNEHRSSCYDILVRFVKQLPNGESLWSLTVDPCICVDTFFEQRVVREHIKKHGLKKQQGLQRFLGQNLRCMETNR